MSGLRRHAGDRAALLRGRLTADARVAAAVERLPPALDPLLRRRRWQQRRLVQSALDDPLLLERFRAGARLPEGYGVGLDERVVEHPWVLAQSEVGGRLLDAGSALNHRHVLSHLRPRVSALHVVTLAPERQAYPQLHVSYVYADLRSLPYRDGWFDVVACVSTLEHVGMDNRRYGTGTRPSHDSRQELRDAVHELRRVVARPGTMLVTVPYGESADFGWLRQLDRGELEELVKAAAPDDAAVTVYAYSRAGWQVGDLETASTARYRDRAAEPSPSDLAVNARAVACVRLSYR